MPLSDTRVNRLSAALSSATNNPWNAHRVFALQAEDALERSYAAGGESASAVAIMRRENALRRWRGLADGDHT